MIIMFLVDKLTLFFVFDHRVSKCMDKIMNNFGCFHLIDSGPQKYLNSI